MKSHPLLILIALSGGTFFLTLSGCTSTSVEERQAGIMAAQENMLNNSAARIEARDARFKASRDHWMQ